MAGANPRRGSAIGITLAVALSAACGVPAPLGGQAPVVAATTVAYEGRPASAYIGGVAPSATPLFGGPGPAPPAAATDSIPLQPVPQATPEPALAPLPPDTTALAATPAVPPAPTLIPQAALAATANAATAVARQSRVAATATAVPTQQITIQNFTFTPQTITVPPGTTVVWRNLDGAAHQVAGSDFDSGRVPSAQYWATQFLRPGTFDYVCGIHPTMRGQVVVSPTSAAQRFGS